MKTKNLFVSEATKYTSPSVLRADVSVESGFATSGVVVGLIPSLDEDEYGDY